MNSGRPIGDWRSLSSKLHEAGKGIDFLNPPNGMRTYRGARVLHQTAQWPVAKGRVHKRVVRFVRDFPAEGVLPPRSTGICTLLGEEWLVEVLWHGTCTWKTVRRLEEDESGLNRDDG